MAKVSGDLPLQQIPPLRFAPVGMTILRVADVLSYLRLFRMTEIVWGELPTHRTRLNLLRY
jgi:hypothetical protein